MHSISPSISDSSALSEHSAIARAVSKSLVHILPSPDHPSRHLQANAPAVWIQLAASNVFVTKAFHLTALNVKMSMNVLTQMYATATIVLILLGHSNVSVPKDQSETE
jgi:hypothetical protein